MAQLLPWSTKANLLPAQPSCPSSAIEATVGRITVCAEAIALGAALSAGQRDVDTVVALAHPHAHEEATDSWVTPPCGMCREPIKDYGPNARVIVQGAKGLEKVPVSELLPYDDE